jgi:hypothetical protein
MGDPAETRRLAEAREGVPWRKWGPYLSERQWGTVREDYSREGDAWAYLTHDQSRSRAYRWGEDGLAGVCDDHQQLCLALALWNGNDPILKERLFGLTNAEGNHGEDVKEYYFYVDNVPTHSYQRWAYKYPHAAYPYADLIAGNRQRGRDDMEYELIDTGVFDDDAYFDVVVEHAKVDAEDLVCRITVTNRGAAAGTVHVLPTLWFRNTWSFFPNDPEPSLTSVDGTTNVVHAEHHELGDLYLYAPDDAELLFCDNESNAPLLWDAEPTTPFPKDGINDHVVAGAATVNPAGTGTKVSARVEMELAPGATQTTVVRLSPAAPADLANPLAAVDAVVAERRAEADEFYAALTPPATADDEAAVMRQAYAGMLWSKQFYFFDVDQWLTERAAHPLRRPTYTGEKRNESWFHMLNADIISMPDKWEYPWYAAWDLAFHCLPLAMIDRDFARTQLMLMLSHTYLHPNGQMPAYEWNFGDVNPPVHAFATLLLHDVVPEHEAADMEFLQESFSRLLLNFTWWLNRKDIQGNNVFEGGFLGLDNIGVFDRSKPIEGGGRLEQADGTAWMALFSQNMLELALILAEDDPAYEGFVLKFVEHFTRIAFAIDPPGDSDDEMWDEEDGFFYDVLRMPDGTGQRVKVRSLVGLLPMCATTVISHDVIARFPRIAAELTKYLTRNADLLANIADPMKPGVNGRHILSMVNDVKLRRILTRMLDEDRFLSPHGIRSLSRAHLDEPYDLVVGGASHRVQYEPAESRSGMFGGNSNWRGPVWFPTNLLIIRALLHYYRYYGDDFVIECPTGSGNEMTLFEVAMEITERLVTIFTDDEDGKRAVFGGNVVFQNDPNWHDLIPFYEYFHGDNGAGLGASHQTGWTGLVASLIQLRGNLDADDWLNTNGRLLSKRAFRATT